MSHASRPTIRRRRPSAALALAAGLVAALLAGCGEEPRPLPELPGTPDDGSEWFWRDVLSSALPGEAPPRTDVLEREPPVAVLEGLAELSGTDDPAASTTLMKALRHPVIGVACAAARELGLRGDPATLPRLLKSLGPYPVDYDVPVEVRAAAASALARMGNPTGVPLVLLILEEGTPREAPRGRLPWPATTRMAFIQELAIDALVALAGTDFGFDPDGSIPDREAAAARARAWWDEHRARLWMATAPLPDDPGLVTRIRLLVAHLRTYQLRQIDGAVYTLRQLGPGVVPFLAEGLSSDDDYVRLHVLDVMTGLADIEDRKTRGRLAVLAATPLLEDDSPPVAARAAGVCGAARVADPLVNALAARTEPEVRLAVIDALGATGTDAARALLASWSPDGALPPDQAVALEAARLRLEPDRPLDGLLAALASEDPAVAYPALERLILLTGGDHGVDVGAPPAERADAIEAARDALEDALNR